jgi:hypothetical protein
MDYTSGNEKAPEAVAAAAGALRNAQRHPQYSGRSTKTEAQIQRLLQLLRIRPRHTHELRCAGISHPAGRILDLLKRGYLIDSGRVTTVDADGFTHVNVALYSLMAEPLDF